jgi:hypothetical protein
MLRCSLAIFVAVSFVVVPVVAQSQQVGPIEALCRAAWGARPATNKLVVHEIRRITVHHSGTLFRKDSAAPATIRNFQKWHQTGKGYPDIAYHFLIDRAGNVYEGRDPKFKVDTPTDYDPDGHLSICLLGNFEEQELSSVQMDALDRLLAAASVKYKVPTDQIAGHGDYAHTLCPGKRLREKIRIGEIRGLVDVLVAKSVPELVIVCGDKAQSRIDSIKTSAPPK